MNKIIILVILLSLVVIVSGCVQPTPAKCNYDDPNRNYAFRGLGDNQCSIWDPEVDMPGMKRFFDECGCGFEKEMLKTQSCPDAWYENRQPPDEPNQYLIFDGERREIAEFDMDWIIANCPVNKPEIVV